MFLD
jgi:hypothetical protein